MRTRRTLAATFLACGTVYGASIASAQRVTDTPSSAITVVGCVERTEAPGTVGAAIPERPAPETVETANLGEITPGFALTNAKPAASRAANEPAVESSRADGPKRFILFGSEGELRKHEGHRVRVSGVIEPSTKPAESGAIGTGGSNQVQSGGVRLKVTSIEMIAGDCSAR